MSHLKSLFMLCLFLPSLVLGKEIVVLRVDDVIGPATGDYVRRGLKAGTARSAELIVIKMNTPGGLDTAMRNIIQDIIASPVPVAVFVSPSGARAASAGTYILYAAHIAAMAPGTNLGAATPVQIGGLPDIQPPTGPEETKDGKRDKQNDKLVPIPEDAMTKKMVNDAVAYIRSLAEMHGRNVDWAEQAVREAASLSADAALDAEVIDLVSADLPALLSQLHGRTITVLDQERELQTKNATLSYIEPDWRNRLLAIIANPNVAYILMLLGIYGLFFELANPGFVLPGVIGAISLLLALYAMQVLPVNYAGLGLILLGIAFMVGEAFVPSFGALGIGGVIAFVMGSVILFDTDAEGMAVSLPLIGGVALSSTAFFMGVMAMAVKIHRKPVVSGAEEMLGSVGEVAQNFTGDGRVFIHGESWRAQCDQPLLKGQKVRVTHRHGLTLFVEPETTES